MIERRSGVIDLSRRHRGDADSSAPATIAALRQEIIDCAITPLARYLDPTIDIDPRVEPHPHSIPFLLAPLGVKVIIQQAPAATWSVSMAADVGGRSLFVMATADNETEALLGAAKMATRRLDRFSGEAHGRHHLAEAA